MLTKRKLFLCVILPIMLVVVAGGVLGALLGFGVLGAKDDQTLLSPTPNYEAPKIEEPDDGYLAIPTAEVDSMFEMIPVYNDNFRIVAYSIGKPRIYPLPENLVLPRSYEKNGKLFPVVSVGDDSFASHHELKTVTMHKNITTIDQWAFMGCTSLESVEFPIGSSLSEIGQQAFQDCVSLSKMPLSEKLTTIGAMAFRYCKSLTEVTVPSSIKRLGEYCFNSCTSIKKLNLGQVESGVSIWGAFAWDVELEEIHVPSIASFVSIDFKYTSEDGDLFSDGTKLFANGNFVTSVTAADLEGVSKIEQGVFVNYNFLESVEIPACVSEISHLAFNNCENLTSVTFKDPQNSLLKSIGAHAFRRCGFTTLELPSSSTGMIIQEGAFGYSNLQSITIPKNVTQLDARAFAEAHKLESVDFEANSRLMSIGDECFKDCRRLENFVFPKSSMPLIIGYRILPDNSEIESITIKSVFVMADGAFENHLSLKSVTIDSSCSMRAIPMNCFKGCSQLEEVVINCTSIKTIEHQAFEECVSLKEIALPSSVTTLQHGVFGGCSALSSVTHSSITQIGSGCFSSCTSLTSFEIPELATIPSNVFNNTGLESVTIPASVQTIEGWAFGDCVNLSSVTFVSNSNLQSIGDWAFDNCEKLSSFTIPSTVSSIGESAFADTALSSFESVSWPISITEIPMQCFYGCNFTSVVIPSHVTSIGDNAFGGCQNLVTLSIGSQVTHIGEFAFYGYGENGYTKHESYTIPSTVQAIGQGAFSGFASKIVIPNGAQLQDYAFLKYYDEVEFSEVVFGSNLACNTFGDVFENSSAIQKVTIGENSISIIELGAFQNCNQLEEIVLPQTIEIIEDYAFYGCHSLQSIAIPNSVTSIGYCVFGGCTNLSSVSIGSGVTSLDPSTFEGCQYITSLNLNYSEIGHEFSHADLIETITLGNNVTTIADFAFDNCYNLLSVSIGSGVESIGSYAFSGCTSLATVSIGNGVTSIGDYAFSYCTGLTEIDIPNNVTSIGESAFSDCTGLASVTIGNSVTSIGSYAFFGCTSLATVSIGNGVTSIGESAFYGCTGLASVTIGSGVTSIGYSAFYGCSGLETINLNYATIGDEFSYKASIKTIVLGNDVEAIGSDAFRGCTGLTEIDIPNNVTSIGSSAFFDCTGLTEIDIPNNVTSIGDFAFSSCTGLASVTIGNSVTSIGSSAFFDCTGLETINLNYATIGDEFRGTSIETIIFGNDVETIGGSAFSGCTGLTEIDIPNNVTSIGDFAFDYCYNLLSVSIGSSVSYIGDCAFHRCFSLVEVWNLSSLDIVAGSFEYGGVAGFALAVYTDASAQSRVSQDSNGFLVYSDDQNDNYVLVGVAQDCWPDALPQNINGHNYSIRDYAFYTYSTFSSLTIPSSVISVGDCAFGGSQISSITFETNPNLESLSDTMLSGNDSSSTCSIFINNEFESFDPSQTEIDEAVERVNNLLSMLESQGIPFDVFINHSVWEHIDTTPWLSSFNSIQEFY